MASQRARKHDTCAHENCGSRRFHAGEDGFTYCDQGHQQSERGTVIAEDTGEMMLLGKKSRKKDSDAESATSRGKKGAFELRFRSPSDRVSQLRVSVAHKPSNITCFAYSLSCASRFTGSYIP